ncbi:HD domain-containing protein [Streptomyces sp. NPDC002643]
MGVLRALLIAVPVQGLEFVREDTKQIKKALLQSGWAASDVTVLDTLERTTRDDIYAAFKAFFEQCEDDDFALVHFSGHGVRIGDREFLKPANANRDAEEMSLIEVVPDVLFRHLVSQATVMMCLDACRDDAEGEFKPPATFPASSRSRENVFVVHACAAGEQAYGTESGSFMSRALADALSPHSPPKNVREVITYVRRRTNQIAKDNGASRHHRVEDRWLGGADVASAPARHAEREICENGPGTEDWGRVVHDSGLWDRVTEPGVDKGKLKDLLSPLITKVLAIRQNAELPTKAGPDPWDDVQFPQRVLQRLDRLIPPAPEGGRLSPLEAVALLATPFVREAAVACGRRALAECAAQEPGENDKAARKPSAGREAGIRQLLRQDLADVRKAYDQIDTKRRRLLADRSDSAATAVESWLQHRLLADWDQLWVTADGSGAATIGALDSLREVMEILLKAAEFAAGLGSRPPARSHDNLRSALLQLVSQMRTPPAVNAPNGKEWQRELATQLGLDRRKRWRPRELAGLLHIAELLAVDPRSLDGIVVDHLGERHLRVSPEDVVAQIRGSEFHPVDHAPSPAPGQRVDWTLQSDCDSAPLHVALERQAEAAATAARNLYKAIPNEDLLDALPKHVNTDALLADTNRGYEAPPPRFQLAEDGVKPLIMGTQLYGDRMLAVRELYQNALDACRRRWARQKYAQQTARSGSGAQRVKELAEYRVEFKLGRDSDDQRIYIECVDHGIGMTEEELRDLFARAGRRYEQSPTRVRELRRWRREDIDPELNSRFGIGVFSYFMLAERITVITRPASETGRAADGPAHRVDVVADSGLMHITKDERTDAGTTIRLYLRPEDCANPPSLIKFLQEQVWHTPVQLRVRECLDPDNPREEPWTPNVLKADVTLAVPQAETPDGPWWVRGEGARLVDGIFVGEDERPHGYVINLRRRHAPRLSANRNRLQEFDSELAYRELAAATGDVLTRWEPVPLSWLWELLIDDVRLGESVLERLLAAEITVSVTDWHNTRVRSPVRLPLKAIGCLLYDNPSTANATGERSAGPGHQYFRSWRAQLVRTEIRRSEGAQKTIGRPQGFPKPSALDALLFREHSGLVWPLTAALQASWSGEHSLRTTFRGLRRYAVVGIILPGVDDVRALDAMMADPLLVDLYNSYTPFKKDASAPADVEPSVHFPLLQAARRYNRSLGEIADLVRRLRAFEPRIPEPPHLGELAGRIPDQHDLAVLVGDDGLNLPAAVTPAVAAYVATREGVRFDDVLDIVRRYERFGFHITDHVGTSHASDAPLPDLDDPFREPSLLDKPFSLFRLVRLSAERGDADVGETAEYVRGFAERLGMGEISPGPLAAVRAPAWWADLPLNQERDHQPFNTWTVLHVLADMPRGEPPEDIVRSVENLATAGLVDPAACDAVRTWLETPQERRPYLLMRDGRKAEFRWWSFNGRHHERPDHVDIPYLLELAAERHDTLADAAEEMRAQAEPYGIEVVEVPAESCRLRPDNSLIDALIDEGPRWKTEITYSDIVPFAHGFGLGLADAIAELRKYEPLGAPRLPSALPAPSGQWDKPDRKTALALENLLQYEPLLQGTVTPLTLTVTAVRMDLGLRSTFAALASYTDCGIAIECPEPEDDDPAPDWRDVIILTPSLTGAEPALSGEVTEDHIQLASEETDLSVDEVRERLVHYAPLFGFRLPTPRDAQVPEEGSAHA